MPVARQAPKSRSNPGFLFYTYFSYLLFPYSSHPDGFPTFGPKIKKGFTTHPLHINSEPGNLKTLDINPPIASPDTPATFRYSPAMYEKY